MIKLELSDLEAKTVIESLAIEYHTMRAHNDPDHQREKRLKRVIDKLVASSSDAKRP